MLLLWLFKSQFGPEYIEVQLIIPIYCVCIIYCLFVYLSNYLFIPSYRVLVMWEWWNSILHYLYFVSSLGTAHSDAFLHRSFIESVKSIIKMSRWLFFCFCSQSKEVESGTRRCSKNYIQTQEVSVVIWIIMYCYFAPSLYKTVWNKISTW